MSVLNIGTTSFYRHSGRVPILGLILLGAAGFILIPILAVIYGYLIYYVPSLSIYLGILLVLAYAFAGGYVLSKAASLGKIRNKLIVFLAALAFGLFAEYVGWVAWIAALAEDPAFLIEFFFPLDILYLITEIAKEGVWSISGGTPTGGALYAIWLAEAIMVVGGMIYFALQSSSDVPFCEESDAWASKKSVLGFFAPLTDIAAFRSAIEQGNLSVFHELNPVQSGSAFTMFDLYECDVCKNFYVLNVRDVKITTDYRGRQNRKEKKVVSNLIVSPSTISGLKRLFEEQQGQQAAGATATG